MRNIILKSLQNIVQVISAIIALFVLYTIVFTKLNRENVVFDFAGKILLEDYVVNGVLLFIIGFLVWFWIKKTKIKEDVFDKGDKIKLFIAMLILLFFQIFFVAHIYFYAGNDALNIRIGAEKFVNGEFDSFYNLVYYQVCPNNLMAYFLYILAYFFAKYTKICSGYTVLVACNIILTNVAVLLSTLSAYKMTKRKNCMWLVFCFAVLLFGITPWLSVPYTDTLSIAFPISSLYIYLCLREKDIPLILKWLFILLIPFLTYGLKPLNIIVAIAIILCEILHFNFSKQSLKKIPVFLGALLMILILVMNVQTAIEKKVGYQADKNQELSLVWVLFLGSDNSTYGQWSFENLQYSLQYETQEERQGALLDKVVERMSAMGVTGYLQHWMNKVHIFYNDGNFGWGTTGSMVADVPNKESLLTKNIRNIVYPPENYGLVSNYPGYGEYFKYYAVTKQFVWLLIFAFMVIGICRPSKDKRVLVFKITWIGVFLFSMLFEAHARLLVSFLPVFVTIAGFGADCKKKKTSSEKIIIL